MGITDAGGSGRELDLQNPNPTTVYRGPLRVNFRVNQWSGIGMPGSYFYLPTSTTTTCASRSSSGT